MTESYIVIYKSRSTIWRSEGMPYSECEAIIKGSKKLLTKHHIITRIVPYSEGKDIRMIGEIYNED